MPVFQFTEGGECSQFYVASSVFKWHFWQAIPMQSHLNRYRFASSLVPWTAPKWLYIAFRLRHSKPASGDLNLNKYDHMESAWTQSQCRMIKRAILPEDWKKNLYHKYCRRKLCRRNPKVGLYCEVKTVFPGPLLTLTHLSSPLTHMHDNVPFESWLIACIHAFRLLYTHMLQI